METVSGLFGGLSILPKRERPQPKGNNQKEDDNTFFLGFSFIILSFLLTHFSRVVAPAEQQC
jgi:hypothetical protein